MQSMNEIDILENTLFLCSTPHIPYVVKFLNAWPKMCVIYELSRVDFVTSDKGFSVKFPIDSCIPVGSHTCYEPSSV